MAGIRCFCVTAITVFLAPFVVLADQRPGVAGWVVSGSAADKYQALIDRSVAHTGSASASLAATTDAAGSEFGTLMQYVDARPHVGKRMRFSAYVRTAGVSTGAALWMRIDGIDGEVLAFDNMSNRGLIRGNQSWSRTEIVLDVPLKSKLISFGVLLKGEGMLWIDSVSLEAVFKHIATTGSRVSVAALPVAPDDLPLSPANLDFEN